MGERDDGFGRGFRVGCGVVAAVLGGLLLVLLVGFAGCVLCVGGAARVGAQHQPVPATTIPVSR